MEDEFIETSIRHAAALTASLTPINFSDAATETLQVAHALRRFIGTKNDILCDIFKEQVVDVWSSYTFCSSQPNIQITALRCLISLTRVDKKWIPCLITSLAPALQSSYMTVVCEALKYGVHVIFDELFHLLSIRSFTQWKAAYLTASSSDAKLLIDILLPGAEGIIVDIMALLKPALLRSTIYRLTFETLIIAHPLNLREKRNGQYYTTFSLILQAIISYVRILGLLLISYNPSPVTQNIVSIPLDNLSYEQKSAAYACDEYDQPSAAMTRYVLDATELLAQLLLYAPHLPSSIIGRISILEALSSIYSLCYNAPSVKNVIFSYFALLISIFQNRDVTSNIHSGNDQSDHVHDCLPSTSVSVASCPHLLLKQLAVTDRCDQWNIIAETTITYKPEEETIMKNVLLIQLLKMLDSTTPPDLITDSILTELISCLIFCRSNHSQDTFVMQPSLGFLKQRASILRRHGFFQKSLLNNKNKTFNNAVCCDRLKQPLQSTIPARTQTKSESIDDKNVNKVNSLLTIKRDRYYPDRYIVDTLQNYLATIKTHEEAVRLILGTLGKRKFPLPIDVNPTHGDDQNTDSSSFLKKQNSPQNDLICDAKAIDLAVELHSSHPNNSDVLKNSLEPSSLVDIINFVCQKDQDNIDLCIPFSSTTSEDHQSYPYHRTKKYNNRDHLEQKLEEEKEKREQEEEDNLAFDIGCRDMLPSYNVNPRKLLQGISSGLQIKEDRLTSEFQKKAPYLQFLLLGDVLNKTTPDLLIRGEINTITTSNSIKTEGQEPTLSFEPSIHAQMEAEFFFSYKYQIIYKLLTTSSYLSPPLHLASFNSLLSSLWTHKAFTEDPMKWEKNITISLDLLTSKYTEDMKTFLLKRSCKLPLVKIEEGFTFLESVDGSSSLSVNSIYDILGFKGIVFPYTGIYCLSSKSFTYADLFLLCVLHALGSFFSIDEIINQQPYDLSDRIFCTSTLCDSRLQRYSDFAKYFIKLFTEAPYCPRIAFIVLWKLLTTSASNIRRCAFAVLTALLKRQAQDKPQKRTAYVLALHLCFIKNSSIHQDALIFLHKRLLHCPNSLGDITDNSIAVEKNIHDNNDELTQKQKKSCFQSIQWNNQDATGIWIEFISCYVLWILVERERLLNENDEATILPYPLNDSGCQNNQFLKALGHQIIQVLENQTSLNIDTLNNNEEVNTNNKDCVLNIKQAVTLLSVCCSRELKLFNFFFYMFEFVQRAWKDSPQKNEVLSILQNQFSDTLQWVPANCLDRLLELMHSNGELCLPLHINLLEYLTSIIQQPVNMQQLSPKMIASAALPLYERFNKLSIIIAVLPCLELSTISQYLPIILGEGDKPLIQKTFFSLLTKPSLASLEHTTPIFGAEQILSFLFEYAQKPPYISPEKKETIQFRRVVESLDICLDIAKEHADAFPSETFLVFLGRIVDEFISGAIVQLPKLFGRLLLLIVVNFPNLANYLMSDIISRVLHFRSDDLYHHNKTKDQQNILLTGRLLQTKPSQFLPVWEDHIAWKGISTALVRLWSHATDTTKKKFLTVLCELPQTPFELLFQDLQRTHPKMRNDLTQYVNYQQTQGNQLLPYYVRAVLGLGNV